MCNTVIPGSIRNNVAAKTKFPAQQVKQVETDGPPENFEQEPNQTKPNLGKLQHAQGKISVFFFVFSNSEVFNSHKKQLKNLFFLAQPNCPTHFGDFSQKIGLCHLSALMDPYHHAKGQKKLMGQF